MNVIEYKSWYLLYLFLSITQGDLKGSKDASYIFEELIDKYGGSAMLLNGLAVSKMHQVGNILIYLYFNVCNLYVILICAIVVCYFCVLIPFIITVCHCVVVLLCVNTVSTTTATTTTD